MEIIGNDQSRLATDTESIKLIKNTKGYNWEIKSLSLDIAKLKKINDEMLKEYGETATVSV